jgi:hypothetical protein
VNALLARRSWRRSLYDAGSARATVLRLDLVPGADGHRNDSAVSWLAGILNEIPAGDRPV